MFSISVTASACRVKLSLLDFSLIDQDQAKARASQTRSVIGAGSHRIHTLATHHQPTGKTDDAHCSPSYLRHRVRSGVHLTGKPDPWDPKPILFNPIHHEFPL
jgi:hypothetical protein